MNTTDTHDEHAGKGGSYVIENGKRVLQERTGYTVPQPKQAAPAKTVNPTKKGVNNA